MERSQDSSESPSLAPRSSGLPGELRRFLQVLAALVAICLAVEIFSREVLHLGYPYNWPLMMPDVNFFDFRAYFGQFLLLHTPQFFQGPDILMYPAPVVVCYWFFYGFQPLATWVFVGFILMASLIAAFMVVRALERRGMQRRWARLLVFGSYLLAYPLWFELKQANTEIIVWCFLSLGLFFFFRQKSWGAATFIGLAAALKFYPIIYLGLLLSQKRYRECAYGCVVAGVVILASLWLLGPTIPIAWHGTQAGLALFRQNYMLVVRPNEIGFDHSLFSDVKSILALSRFFKVTPLLSIHFRSVLLSAYLAAASLCGVVLYFVRIRHLPIANQILCISVASILLPPVSFDYTLIHLYAPWTVLAFVALKAQQRNVRIRGLEAIFVGLALAMAPLSEFIFRHERFGGQIRSLILLFIFVFALLRPFVLPGTAMRTPDEVDAMIEAG